MCYSWWVLSSLAILGRLRWIDKDSLRRFILAAQDIETGGVADRPGDIVIIKQRFCITVMLRLMLYYSSLNEKKQTVLNVIKALIKKLKT